MSKIDRQLAGFDFVDEAPATMGKVVGFDVGGESTMVVDDSGVIVRNELGGHSSSSSKLAMRLTRRRMTIHCCSQARDRLPLWFMLSSQMSRRKRQRSSR